MVSQAAGQLTRRVVAAAIGALAQVIEAVAVRKPAGQPQLGHVGTGVGQRADDLDGLIQLGPVGQSPAGVSPVRQPAGQLPPSMIVSSGGQRPKLINLIVLSQDVGAPPPRRITGLTTRRTRSSHVLKCTGLWISSARADQALGPAPQWP